MNDVLLVLVVALATAAALMTVTALIARAIGRVAVVDIAWGLGFVAIAATTALAANEGAARRWVVLALVVLWGFRLAWHIRRRAVGHGEDPRYEALLGGPVSEVGIGIAVRKVFVVQGFALVLISLPVQVGAALEVRWWPLVVAGSVVWLIGMVFESVGDAQLAAYKADPDRGPVMDRGLWGWTRHPNYFGDACVWWGLSLIAFSSWPGILTILSPLAMTWLLAKGTGKPLLEKDMSSRRPGYADYVRRTSGFVPLPPKKHAPTGGTA